MGKSMALPSVQHSETTSHTDLVQASVEQSVAMSIQLRLDIDVGMTTLARTVAAVMEVAQAMLVLLLVATLYATNPTRENVIQKNALKCVLGKSGANGVHVPPTVLLES